MKPSTKRKYAKIARRKVRKMERKFYWDRQASMAWDYKWKNCPWNDEAMKKIDEAIERW